jgi:hypothetical protein
VFWCDGPPVRTVLRHRRENVAGWARRTQRDRDDRIPKGSEFVSLESVVGLPATALNTQNGPS